MSTKKTILVTGITGAQGGSVAKYLLNEGKFHVRGLTRYAGSAKAKAWTAAGVEIVEGSLDDIDSLVAAMHDVYAVFGVTNFWEHFGSEYKQGINLVDAVMRSGINHFVYSSQPGAKTISQGRITVPHYDMKAEVEKYARNLKADTSFVQVAAYYENFATLYHPHKGYDGNFYFGFPQGQLKYATASVADLGGIVKSIFNDPERYKGKTIGVVGEFMTVDEYAAIMTEELGRTILYNNIPREQYAAFDFRGAGELASMFEFNRLFDTDRQKDLEESRRIHPGMQSFRNWVRENKNMFSLPVTESWVLTGS